MKRILRTVVLFAAAVGVVGAQPIPTVIDTDMVPWDVGPADGITLKRFNGNLARINIVRWEGGTLVASHTHATEQIILVQSGRYRVTLENEVHVLEAGDLMVFPSFAPHGIEALEDSAHIAVFAPASLPD